MMDTWFSATVLLGLLSLCAFLRVIPGPTYLDRVVAANAGITLAAAAALTYSISVGSLTFLCISIIIVLILFAGTSLIIRYIGGESV